MTVSPTALNAALDAHALGLCVVPPKQDGSKAPIAPGGEWKQLQTTRPDEAQIRAWYERGLTGVGLVCGAVSGDLEMFEFEGRAIDELVHTRFEELARAAGLGDVVQRIFDGYCETTPGRGIHLLYRCTAVGKPKKLARRPSTPDELAAWKAKEQAGIDALADDDPKKAKRQAALDKVIHGRQVPQVLIETKGEGGYTIVAPSNGSVHPTGGAWELTTGSFASIATITPEERAELHRVAAMLDQMPVEPAAPDRVPGVRRPTDDTRPGDEYNTGHDAAQRTVELLEAHGWQVAHRAGHDGHEDVYVRRPGKARGISGVVHMDAGTFVNWSTSVLFDQEVGYSPFAVLAMLEHAGDYSAAAKELRPHGPDLYDMFHIERPGLANELSPPPDDPRASLDDVEPAIPRRHAIDGAEFVRADSTTTRPIWGTAEAALWTVGESLLIAAPTGVGKTTVAQQLLLSLIGVRPPELLGQPVTPIDGPVLYIAADRPAQAARSLKRMVTDDDLEHLRQRLIVWRGPPPFDLRKEPEHLSIFGQQHGARLIIIDSLKDLVPDLSKEESGGAYNIARQHALAAGIELAELHHQRKTGSGGGKPKHIEDVYGSTWITAGAGSVVVLWGEAGDPVIELLHLKQPAEQVGPLKIVHDHHIGVTTLADDHVDLLALLRTSTRGVSARSVACALFDTSDPKRNELEKARRRLDALVRKDLATRQDGTRGGPDGGEQALWFPTPHPSMEER